MTTSTSCRAVDLMYLDPPYNQHRYFTNYHIWETLVRWDAPEHYGIACKRIDSRDDATKSVFNAQARDAGRLAERDPAGAAPRSWSCPTTTSRGSPPSR